MIPAGQESGTGRSVDRHGERSALPLLLDAIHQLVETAESNLPPTEKLDLLSIQIGALQFWADQLNSSASPPVILRAPHFSGVESMAEGR
jgi:hypothetical protein